jgi:hypothetical protein
LRDFDYNTALDGSDYTLLDNAHNTQGGQIAAEIGSAPASARPTGQDVSPSSSSVPPTDTTTSVSAELNRHRKHRTLPDGCTIQCQAVCYGPKILTDGPLGSFHPQPRFGCKLRIFKLL